MDSDFLRSVLGQPAPAQGPVSQLPLFQRATSFDAPGLVPAPPPSSGLGGGYPGQPAAVPDFTQLPPAQVTQLPVETPHTFAGSTPLDQWRAAAGKTSMFASPEQQPNAPALEQWRAAHGKTAPTVGGALTAAASPALTALPPTVNASPPTIGAAPQTMDKEALKAADPALHDHVSAHGGFGITEEMLKKLPPAQAEMIRGAGGITMGHLMQLMQTNSPLNSAAEVGKADYVKHSEGLAQLMMDNPGLRVDEKGGVTWPENMLQKSKDAAEEAKKEQLRKMVIYHTYGKQINSPFVLPTLALPGMTGGGN